MELPYDPAIPLLGIYPEKTNSRRYMQPNVYSSAICCDGPHRSTAERSYPPSKVRGGGREEQPHFQGAAAAWAQQGGEELLHVQGQEGRPHPR